MSRVVRCVYCSCTEKRACTIRVGDNPPAILAAIRVLWPEAKDDDRIGCSWFETDPPVCSAPACVAKHTEQLAKTTSP